MPTTVPKIPSQYRWRVKHRLRVLAYAMTHSLKAASRHFGLERETQHSIARERGARCGGAGDR
jgi:hypothetical protein